MDEVELHGMTAQQQQRYERAVHAIQSATKVELAAEGDENRTHKHLRTGLNSCMAEHGALAFLLVRKKLITEQEYFDAVVEGAEQEAERCAKIARAKAGLPDSVTFE